MGDLPLSEQFRLIAKRYVDADAAANLMEEAKSAFLARLMTAKGDIPVSKAEMMVKASDEWDGYIRKMVLNRSEAARLKAQMAYIQMRFQEWQSENATRRAEMRL